MWNLWSRVRSDVHARLSIRDFCSFFYFALIGSIRSNSFPDNPITLGDSNKQTNKTRFGFFVHRNCRCCKTNQPQRNKTISRISSLTDLYDDDVCIELEEENFQFNDHSRISIWYFTKGMVYAIYPQTCICQPDHIKWFLLWKSSLCCRNCNSNVINLSGTYSCVDRTFIDHMSRKQYLQISGDSLIELGSVCRATDRA